MIAEFLNRTGLRRFPNSAEEWVARVQSGKMSGRDQLELENWLERSPDNAREYARCLGLGQLASKMRDYPEMVKSIPAYRRLIASEAQTISPRRNLVPIFGAACATVVLAVVSLSIFSKFPGNGSAGQVITSHGEQRRVPFADGTQIYVNTDSQLTIAFSSSERSVDLKKGEAYFEVKRDPARPFVVHAGNAEVRVVGTQFNVRRNGPRLEVMVTEGKVSVRPDTMAGTGSPAQVVLKPGEKLLIDPSQRLAQVSTVDTYRLSAWRNGVIQFDDMPLELVIADINRYASKPFEIADDSIRSLRISGNFKVGDIDSVRFVLKNGFSIKSEETDASIVLARELRRH